MVAVLKLLIRRARIGRPTSRPTSTGIATMATRWIEGGDQARTGGALGSASVLIAALAVSYLRPTAALPRPTAGACTASPGSPRPSTAPPDRGSSPRSAP